MLVGYKKSGPKNYYLRTNWDKIVSNQNNQTLLIITWEESKTKIVLFCINHRYVFNKRLSLSLKERV